MFRFKLKFVIKLEALVGRDFNFVYGGTPSNSTYSIESYHKVENLFRVRGVRGGAVYDSTIFIEDIAKGVVKLKE